MINPLPELRESRYIVKVCPSPFGNHNVIARKPSSTNFRNCDYKVGIISRDFSILDACIPAATVQALIIDVLLYVPAYDMNYGKPYN
jgi:hypothetical protein